MKVSVLETDIKFGICRSAMWCPVARAVARLIKGQILVTGSTIDERTGKGRVWTMPDIAVKFVSDFDQGKAVRPFEFELEDK